MKIDTFALLLDVVAVCGKAVLVDDNYSEEDLAKLQFALSQMTVIAEGK